MATISEALATALQHHQAGRLQAAEQIYRQILAVAPDHADALHMLGVIAQQVRKHELAIQYIRRALELKPESPETHYNLGTVLTDQGRLDEAAACYRRSLELKPDYAEAHSNLGIVLTNQGKLDEAVACYRRALELKPDYAEIRYNLGTALTEQGRLDEAVACYRRALELEPDFAEAHNNLGKALKDLGRLDEAVACYRRALVLKPDYAEAHNNLGSALADQGQLDEAVACCRRALLLKPDLAEAHNNLGNALTDLGRRDEAVACYRQALELKRDYAEAHNNLGNALTDLGRLDEAVACYRRALELKPDYLDALSALTHQLQHMCLWKDLDCLARRLVDAVARPADGLNAAFVATPFAFLGLSIATTAQQQLQCARRWVEGRLKPMMEIGAGLRLAKAHAPRPKITLGYLSADFREHPVAVLMVELIEKHDRGRFEVLGYSYGPDDGSDMRRRLRKAFDRFADIRPLAHREAARQIAADSVDILVDLTGYTQHARTEILALRPAPLQVNFLGYTGTMAADFMDYIVVDGFVVPADRQPFFSEKLVHLPGCYLVNDSQRKIAPNTPSRVECGLPDKGFVFCTFNNSYKITAEFFDVWMNLLKEVPGSVLWLLEGNRFVPGNLRREAQARGIRPERLVFAPRISLPEHLARHRLADLFLDTLPYNAHTTASDSLWAGCPVLTLSGETFPSRVAGSLLQAVGLPDLITRSLEEYHLLALRLARDGALLGRLRSRLEVNRRTSRLFSAEPFARNLEKAYSTMWEIYASGETRRGFSVSPV